MKWQITKGQSRIYVDPAIHSIIIYDGRLVNKVKMARRIFEGANKSVCAWIEASSYEIVDRAQFDKDSYFEVPVAYNPRVVPNWQDFRGANIDNQNFGLIITEGRKLKALVNIE